jgi:Arc/MetJ-type ribon-helix-helix transcriptional regulator
MRMVSNKTSRVKITLTLPADLAKWVDERVEAREYATRSHALEVALLELKKNKHKSARYHRDTGRYGVH